MRTYKEYLIPETIDHKELKYLVSIGSNVLVKTYHPTLFFEIICQLWPSNEEKLNQEFSPLTESDIHKLTWNMVSIHYINYYTN